jgi:hypothetical protein
VRAYAPSSRRVQLNSLCTVIPVGSRFVLSEPVAVAVCKATRWRNTWQCFGRHCSAHLGLQPVAVHVGVAAICFRGRRRGGAPSV